MAKGIQASGERNRKKLSIGKRACLARKCRPSHKPAGMPSNTESKNPTATRHNDAIMSSSKRPATISSLKLFSTAPGEGIAYPGKRFMYDTKYHSSNNYHPANAITNAQRRNNLRQYGRQSYFG